MLLSKERKNSDENKNMTENKTSDKKYILIQILTALFGAVLSVCPIIFAYHYNSDFIPPAFLLGLGFITLAIISVLVFELHRSIKKTVYSYKNIMLSGAVLFVFVLFTALVSNFISWLYLKDTTVHGIYALILGFPRRFSYYAVFVIIAVSVIVGISNVALIRHEGFRPQNALSVLIAAVYVGGTLIIYYLTDWFSENVFMKYGLSSPVMVWLNTVIPLFALSVLCYFECVLVGTAFMGWKAARQVPKYNKDYIIILGCSIDKKGGLLPLLKGRVNRAVRFAWEQEIASGKPLKYVPSGGQGANEVMSEGSAMALYLMTKGAEEYEVFPEKKSTDTYENMLFSKKIIDELTPDAEIAFATTNYHMLRSGIIARKAGIDAEGIAGDTKWYFWPNGFIREFFGIIALNIKTHITVAAVLAFLSALVGFIGCYANFL